MVGFIIQDGRKAMKNFAYFSILFASLSTAYATELTINTSSGNDYYLDIQPQVSFQEVIETLQKLENPEIADGLYISMNVQKSRIEARTKTNQSATPRNYYSSLTEKDKENITHLLTSLANQSIIKIAFKRSALTKVGDQVEHVHPMAFLRFVFTNDELIVAMRNIRDKSLLWDDFVERILDSLDTEMSLGNLTQDQIYDLAVAVKVDLALIDSPIQVHDWRRLIDNLIQNVQRSGNTKRYDM